MPGIAGLITRMPRAAAERELLSMMAAVNPGSAYVKGIQIDADSGTYLGWTAQKHSFADNMPLCNETGDISLVFSGEEYSGATSIYSLKNRHHSFDPDGPSYLVHLYEENPRFVAGLNGRFHGLLVDRQSGIAVLFNDRYGMHRIYYHETPEVFYFAAEAKAILAVRPELRTLDNRGLGEFISCGCVLENRTLFRNIHVLPPASSWRFRAGKIERKESYFQPKEWEEQPTSDSETFYGDLQDSFSHILPRYFLGKERIGMSVTGGLDTRMILAWHKPLPGTMPCYSFAGAYRDSQDVILGRRVAAACGQSHEVIPIDANFLSQFPHYAERTVFLTDGCVDVSHSPDLYINERAREIAPVRMTGNYGGEVLRRVRAFKPVDPPAGLFRQEVLPHLEAARATYNDLIQGHPLSFAVFRQAPWHHYGLLALEQTQLTVRSPFLDNDLVRAVYRAPLSATRGNDVSLRLIAEGNRGLLDIRTDRGLAGDGMRPWSALLCRYLEFTFKAEYACDYGMPQWAARIDRLLSPLHPERLFLGRHKFYHFRVWYRDVLAKHVQELLLDSRSLSRPYLHRRKVEEIVRSHTSGTGNYTVAIHKLLTLELLHQLFVDGATASRNFAPTSSPARVRPEPPSKALVASR